MTIPNDPDALLTRDQVAAALSAAGFPVKPKTLATKASRGGGPQYRLFGARVRAKPNTLAMYCWENLRKPSRSRRKRAMARR
jgi:hypothetical protein